MDGRPSQGVTGNWDTSYRAVRIRPAVPLPGAITRCELLLLLINVPHGPGSAGRLPTYLT